MLVVTWSHVRYMHYVALIEQWPWFFFVAREEVGWEVQLDSSRGSLGALISHH